MYYNTFIYKNGTKEVSLTDAFPIKETCKAMGFKFDGSRKTWNKNFNTAEELGAILVDVIIAAGMSRYDAEQFIRNPLSLPDHNITPVTDPTARKKLHAYLKNAKKF